MKMLMAVVLMLAMFAFGGSVHADNLHRELREAVKAGDLDRIQRVLKAGTNRNPKYWKKPRVLYSRGGPLHLAAEEGHTGAVELLLNAGADVNARTFLEKRTPLHRAAMFGNPAAVDLLLKAGADVDLSPETHR